jgi:hypothetical protein
MQPYKRFVFGLIGIVIVYSIYYLFFEGYYHWNIPRKLKHVGRVASIIGVYGIGTLSLKNGADKWMMTLWHLIHTALIVVLVFIGLYDWTIEMVSYPTKKFAQSLHEFLISPVLFVGMWILRSKLVTDKPSKGL